LLYFHGFPSSRLEARLGDAEGAARGVRLIAPDRPGFGRSDFQKGRGLLDWPEDVEVLARVLGLDRFAVAGVSGGGPYALAVAYRFPRRVTAAGIVAGLPPLDRPESLASMSWLHRLVLDLASKSHMVARALLRIYASWLVRRPEAVLSILSAGAPPADRAVLARPAIREAVLNAFREGFRWGSRGCLVDLEIFRKPWGFSLEEIETPVHLWHGERDATIPASLGRVQAEALRECAAVFHPEEGHFSLPINRMGEILEALRRPE